MDDDALLRFDDMRFFLYLVLSLLSTFIPYISSQYAKCVPIIIQMIGWASER